MKILQQKKIAIELTKKYCVRVKTFEEYIKVLEWHNELNHTWVSGTKPLENKNFFTSNSALYTSNLFMHTHSINVNLNFEDFLRLAYK